MMPTPGMRTLQGVPATTTLAALPLITDVAVPVGAPAAPTSRSGKAPMQTHSPQRVAEDVVREFLAGDTAARALGITVSHVAP
jgi:hypothetical protein